VVAPLRFRQVGDASAFARSDNARACNAEARKCARQVWQAVFERKTDLWFKPLIFRCASGMCETLIVTIGHAAAIRKPGTEPLCHFRVGRSFFRMSG
jgi:hypothetical protein